MSANQNTTPCIDFSRETYINRKQITKILHENKVEFTPTQNSKGEYQAQIKLKVSPTKVNKMIEESLGDPDLLAKIDRLFQIDSTNWKPPPQVKEFIPSNSIKQTATPKKHIRKRISPRKENVSPPLRPEQFPTSLRPPKYPMKKNMKMGLTSERKAVKSNSPLNRSVKPFVPLLKLPQPFVCGAGNLSYESPREFKNTIDSNQIARNKSIDQNQISAGNEDKKKEQNNRQNKKGNLNLSFSNKPSSFKKVVGNFITKTKLNKTRSQSTPQIEQVIQDIKEERVIWNKMKKETIYVNDRVNSLVKFINENKDKIDEYRTKNKEILNYPTENILKEIEVGRNIEFLPSGRGVDSERIEITVSSRKYPGPFTNSNPDSKRNIEASFYFIKSDYDSNTLQQDLFYGSLKLKEAVNDGYTESSAFASRKDDNSKTIVPDQSYIHRVKFLGGAVVK